MRRLRTALLLLLVLCGVFAAAASAGEDDGTLSVQGAAGFVGVDGTGTVIGRVEGYSTVRIIDPDPTDGSPLQLPRCPDRQNVSSNTLDPNDKVIVCTGEDIRFRLVGGTFRVRISGSGIWLSMAGQGKVALRGASENPVDDAPPTGTYAVNDSEPAPMPVRRVFTLDASATT